MRSLRLVSFAVAGASLLGLSCGSSAPPVTWQITPSATAAVNDGNTPTNIIATLQVGGQPVPDGTQVSFGVTGAASYDAITASNPGVTQTTSGTTTNGQLTIQLFDLAVETVQITLTSTVDFGTTQDTVTGSTSVHFGGTCPDSQIAPAASNATNGSGVAQHIKFVCNNPVMGGSFAFDQNHPFENGTQTCTASVSDAKEQAVVGAAVQFLTEAGAVETQVQKYGQHPTMVTDDTGEAQVNFRVTTPYPEDVPWDANLDGYFDPCSPGTTVGCNNNPRSWTDSTGHTYNPRDGWVTLVAATPGILPQGAPALPEPYVDKNDNGQYDPGEPFIDVNCDGKFNATQTPDSNGFVRLWSSVVVVWTDEAYPSQSDPIIDNAAAAAGVISGELQADENPTGCGSGGATIPPLGQCQLVFRYVDRNANFPATMLSGNQISFNVSTTCAMTAPGTIPVDLGYTQHTLAPTDYGTVLANGDCSGSSCGPKTYTLEYDGTFNFVDTGNPANAAFSTTVDTITFLNSFQGSCVGP